MASQLKLIADPGTTGLTVHIAGDLDYDTCGELVDFVAGHLDTAPDVGDVRLNFRGLTHIDSSGLAALLAVRRRTAAAGALLHLDERPATLDRMLDLTNTLGHLTAPLDGVPGTGTG
ncbi:STAS domain-containing protein [Streptomyces sp. NPDC007905]|uniref:STAS domain-containing protein n=1 Tax=Streptomyces sp. NPDC007905 TaxID=3364788 RepID=UPI0036E4B783